MKRFAYVCGDPGIPLPGTKGSSAHVTNVCRALRRRGLDGEVYAAAAGETRLANLPLIDVAPRPRPILESPAAREMRVFLGRPGQPPARHPPYDFIYERYSLWHVAGLARARELGIPFVLEVNSPLPEEARRFRALEHAALAEELARVLLREADGVVCVSDRVAEWVTRTRGHAGGVWMIPNGVDPDIFVPGDRLRPEALPPPEVPLIAFCGSFRPWHATDDLLSAFNILVQGAQPEAHLVCVGDGPTREAFERRAAALGLSEQIHLTGTVPQDEVASWLAGADVAVAPYDDLEGFYFSPLKLFEFLALGLPVVAADIGQIRDLAPDGKRGFLYPAGDVDALAARLDAVLQDRTSAERVGAAGREWVLAHATWEKRVAEILEHIAALGAA